MQKYFASFNNTISKLRNVTSNKEAVKYEFGARSCRGYLQTQLYERVSEIYKFLYFHFCHFPKQEKPILGLAPAPSPAAAKPSLARAVHCSGHQQQKPRNSPTRQDTDMLGPVSRLMLRRLSGLSSTPPSLTQGAFPRGLRF